MNPTVTLVPLSSPALHALAQEAVPHDCGGIVVAVDGRLWALDSDHGGGYRVLHECGPGDL